MSSLTSPELTPGSSTGRSSPSCSPDAPSAPEPLRVAGSVYGLVVGRTGVTDPDAIERVMRRARELVAGGTPPGEALDRAAGEAPKG